MEKALFSITCETCQARLGVQSEGAVGTIVECPKCGSFVHVIPPAGWQAEAEPAEQHTGEDPGADESPVEQGAGEQGAGEQLPSQEPATASEPAESAEQDDDAAAARETPHEKVSAAAALGPLVLAPSPVELLWRKWLWIGAAPVAGLVVLAGLWSVLFSSSPSQAPSEVVQGPAEPAPAQRPEPPGELPGPVPSRIDQRWIPDQTSLLVSFRPSQLAEQANSGKLIDQIDPVWRPSFGAVLRSLGLKLDAVRRITWASTDLADWPHRSVVLVELEAEHDAGVLAATGEAIDLQLGAATCRRLPRADWPHPFAVLDQHTIVTGSAELLRQLAVRDKPRLRSAPLERLLKAILPGGDLTLLVDLDAARAANWRLPNTLLDVWPLGREPWHVIWEMPAGLGCTLSASERLVAELALVCEGETTAKAVEAALAEFAPAVRESLAARIESLTEKLRAGEMTAATAHQYELVLKEALVVSQSARWEIADEMVWVRVGFGAGAARLSSAAIDSRPAIRNDWLAAAREVDEANHQRLLAGLLGYQKAEGRFPDAASNSVVLAPETRLSWIAAMLPYYGHADWHRQLEFGYRWNGVQNRDVAGRLLPEVVNAALGPSETEAGFPVTHYVGVAGVGADAARLKADHPRAGVFGYGRGVRAQDVADGASNTVALLGVTDRLGAWAAGGEATVRALTSRPYVNGPDGFGSGQADGMLAGMADGSVRFISAEVDPGLLEQLATIGGHEDTTVAALDPRPVLPGPKLPQPPPVEPKPVEPEPVADAPIERPAALPQIDAEARLAETVTRIELADAPLAAAVKVVAEMSTLPVTFDPDAMTQLGVTLHDPVSVRLSGATVGKVLQQIVAGRRLAYVVDRGQVLITLPPEMRERLYRVPYTVSDLTGPEPVATADLALLVRRMVAPDSWRSGGGRGTIDPQGGTLAVVQTGEVHYRILVFCEKLRNARRLPLLSRLDRQRFTLATRTAQAKAILDRPVTANFHEPAPLVRILGYLAELGEADLLIDRLTLAAAGVSDKTEATVKVDKQPLAAALEQLLRPLGLAYRVIDGRTLQVTTRKAAAARLEVEFHGVAELLSGGPTVDELIEKIKGSVAGASWSDAGGSGVLHYDQPSGCLIVLQSQPVQAAVERFLGEQRGDE